MKRRTIVVGLVENSKGQLLFCKMPANRGVFPGKWSLPGGGVEDDETIESALNRELIEEIGIVVEDVRPAFFKDGFFEKLHADGSKNLIYMIFLIFLCRTEKSRVTLNSEFTDYCWADRAKIGELDLSTETADTLRRAGYLD